MHTHTHTHTHTQSIHTAAETETPFYHSLLEQMLSTFYICLPFSAHFCYSLFVCVTACKQRYNYGSKGLMTTETAQPHMSNSWLACTCCNTNNNFSRDLTSNTSYHSYRLSCHHHTCPDSKTTLVETARPHLSTQQDHTCQHSKTTLVNIARPHLST